MFGGLHVQGSGLSGKATNELSVICLTGDKTVLTKNLRSHLSRTHLEFGQSEIVQQGEVPDPLIGASMVSIPRSGRYRRALLLGGNIQPNIESTGAEVLCDDTQLYTEVSSDNIYVLTYLEDCSEFVWRKLDIHLPTPVSYHSAAYIEKVRSVVVLGGVTLHQGNAISRQPLSAFLVNIDTLQTIEYNLGTQVCLSATCILQTGPYHLDILGGYSSEVADASRKENCPLDFWGKLSFFPSSTPGTVQFDSSSLKTMPFANGRAFLIDNCVVIFPGTRRQVLLLTSAGPDYTKCGNPNCSILSEPSRHNQFIQCDSCSRWLHASCQGITEDQFKSLSSSSKAWKCLRSDCKTIRNQK